MKPSASVVISYTGNRDREPHFATAGSAGADLRASLKSPLSVAPGERVMVPTGLCLAIPQGYEGQVRPRSGMAWKKGLTVLNAPGTIDSDYRGEVQVLLVNLGKEEQLIAPDERIAQLVISPIVAVSFRHVENLEETVRGEGGFGSTGS